MCRVKTLNIKHMIARSVWTGTWRDSAVHIAYMLRVPDTLYALDHRSAGPLYAALTALICTHATKSLLPGTPRVIMLWMEYMSETAAPKEENDWVTVMVLGALFCHLQSTVVVVFALNRSFYPTSAVHPVSVLILHPRKIQIITSDSETEKSEIANASRLANQVRTYRVREHTKHGKGPRIIVEVRGVFDVLCVLQYKPF